MPTTPLPMALTPSRVCSLFLAVGFCGLTFVLAISPWIAPGISLIPLYVWEIVVLTAGITGVFIIICCLNRRTEVRYRDRQYMYTDGIPWARFCERNCLWVFTVMCGIGSVAFFSYTCYQTFGNTASTCSETLSSTSKEIMKTENVRNTVLLLFCVCQLIFVTIIQFKRLNLTQTGTTISMYIVIGASSILCIEVYLNIFKEARTRALKPENSTSFITPSFNYSFAFLKCSHNGTFFETDIVSEKVYRYTYSFPLEFALLLMCCLLDKMDSQMSSNNSENDRVSQQSSISNDSDLDSSENTRLLVRSQRNSNIYRNPLLFRRVGRLLANFIFSYSMSIVLIVLFTIIFGARLVLDILRNSDIIVNVIYHPYKDQRLVTLQKVITYSQFVAAFMHIATAVVGFLFIILKRKNKKIVFKVEHKLLVFGATGLLILDLFQIVDNCGNVYEFNHSTDLTILVVYLFKTLFELVLTYTQTVLIVTFSKMHIETNNHLLQSKKDTWISNMVLFVGYSDFLWWATDNFLNPNGLIFLTQSKNDPYGLKSWWFMTEMLNPVVSVGKLQAAILCFKGYFRFQRVIRENRQLRI